jgi:DNA invertase Pin-like site-specific DNA recombinase
MLQEKKGLNQVCKDDDMPNFWLVSKNVKKNRGFKRKLEKTYAKLPFSVQAGAGRLPEEKFKKKLESLKQSGLSTIEIARNLGVSRNLVRSRLNSLETSLKRR